MAYEQLYRIYDDIMSDIPYEKYGEIVKAYAKKDGLLLDLACGTGRVLVPLIEQGFNVEGVDLSEEMLMVTSDKLASKGLNAPLYVDDMRNLEITDTYDVIYSFLDSLNYLKTYEDIVRTFTGVYNALTLNGYFLFDVHSQDFVKKAFANYCFCDENEDCFYIWQSFVEAENNFTRVYHDWTFFLKRNNGLYKRLIESHEQVIFPLETYLEALKTVGFEVIEVNRDFFKDNSKRQLLVVKKCR